MEFLQKPPPWLTDALPESARDLLDHGGWWVLLGFVGLVLLLLVWAILSRLGRALFGRRSPPPPKDDLAEDLTALPPLTTPGPTRLIYEGVPVRLRLLVLAPAGKEAGINPATVFQLLDRVVPGMGALAAHDQAKVRIWPLYLSYQGFAQTFHNNTPRPEGETNASHWIPLAGRAKIGNQQVLIGLALWTDAATTLTRRTLEPHEWPLVFRIKPHDA